MARGTHRWWYSAPWWAWVVMVACAGVIVVGLPQLTGRGALSAEEADRLEAEVAAEFPESTTAPTAPAAESPLTVTRSGDDPLQALFAGDSLTGGLHASTEDAAFKWLMLDALEATGPVEEFNSAISGGTAREVSEQYEVPAGLDIAVVELGTNDRGEGTPIPEFQAVYDDLIGRIVDGSPGVALVCAGIWETAQGESTDDYNAVIEQSCTSRGGRFVSLTPIYAKGDAIGPPGVEVFGGTSDDFHPNDVGHAGIAAALLAQLAVVAG